MIRLVAEFRGKRARQDEKSPLEYGLAAAFILVALLAVIPGLAGADSRFFLRLP
jgi:Flp pilus assembly pilin Flp